MHQLEHPYGPDFLERGMHPEVDNAIMAFHTFLTQHMVTEEPYFCIHISHSRLSVPLRKGGSGLG